MELISPDSISKSLQKALDLGFVEPEDTTIVFLDLAILDDRIQRLKSCFPKSALHAIAIKSNPLTYVLKYLVELGVGLEAASFGEILLAENASIQLDRLVFDSPAKTRQEIQELIDRFPGTRVNADSLEELSRYSRSENRLRLGVRVNPLISGKTVDYMSVGSAKSKFGEPISNRDSIVDACLNWEAVDCLHLHIGSQNSDLSPNVRAIQEVCKLAKEINHLAGHKKISVIDIGGGFPVNYSGEPLRIEDYAAMIEAGCPEFSDGTFQMITEFGRYVHANACWAATQVEYTKPIPGGTNLITHAGADMFLRECYNPNDWFHEMFLLDPGGNRKDGELSNTSVAGPLCFGGDFVARNIQLPPAQPGDYLAICDVGANSFSLWSKHCSRPFPKVIAYRGDGQEMKIAKQRESLHSLIEFWT